MSRNLNSRLQKLECKTSTDEAIVRQWERSGRLYTDLSEDEKTLYCRYWDFPRGIFEQMHDTIGWPLDFAVFAERRYTSEAWAALCAEVERLMLADN